MKDWNFYRLFLIPNGAKFIDIAALRFQILRRPREKGKNLAFDRGANWRVGRAKRGTKKQLFHVKLVPQCMKHMVAFLLLTLVFGGLNAQFNADPILNLENKDKDFLNYGYFLGFNRYGFKFDYKNDMGNRNTDVQVLESTGFNVGLIGEMRLNEFLDLRLEPGLYYNARTLGFPGFMDTEEGRRNAFREIKSTYINFPLLLKIGTRRFGNWKPFLSRRAIGFLKPGKQREKFGRQ